MPRPTVAETLGSLFLGSQGAIGRVVVSWTLAGGAVCGGIVIGVLELLGRGTPGLLVLLGPVLYLAGTLMGALHGVALGVVGRPRDMCRWEALRRAGLAATASLPLLPLSWLVSATVTVGSALRVEFHVGWLLVGVAGSIVGLGLCAWAMSEALVHVRRAYGRCRRRHAGLCVTVAVAVGGAVILEQLGPVVPGMGRSPGWHLSIPLSLLFTLWLWVPVLYVALRQPTPQEAAGPDGGG